MSEPFLFIKPTLAEWNEVASIHIVWSCLKLDPGDGAALSTRIHGVWRMHATDRSRDMLCLQGELGDEQFPGDGTVMLGPEPISKSGRFSEEVRFMLTTWISRNAIAKCVEDSKSQIKKHRS